MVLVQNPDAKLVVAEHGGFLQSRTVPRREQGPLPRIPRLGDAAEEELHVALEPAGKLAVRPSPAEMAEREVHEQVFLLADRRGFVLVGAEEPSDPFVHPPQEAQARPVALSWRFA